MEQRKTDYYYTGSSRIDRAKKKKKTLGYQGIRQEMVSDTSHELCIIPGIYIRMYACITNKLVRILDKPQNNTHRAAVIRNNSCDFLREIIKTTTDMFTSSSQSLWYTRPIYVRISILVVSDDELHTVWPGTPCIIISITILSPSLFIYFQLSFSSCMYEYACMYRFHANCWTPFTPGKNKTRRNK